MTMRRQKERTKFFNDVDFLLDFMSMRGGGKEGCWIMFMFHVPCSP